MPRLDISLGKCSVSKKRFVDVDKDVIVYEPSDKSFLDVLDEVRAKGKSKVNFRFGVGFLRDMRWYWFKLWVNDYWHDRQPASGILCPILGRHWYKDWKGNSLLSTMWTAENFTKSIPCLHCGQPEVIMDIPNPYPAGKIPFVYFKGRENK